MKSTGTASVGNSGEGIPSTVILSGAMRLPVSLPVEPAIQSTSATPIIKSCFIVMFTQITNHCIRPRRFRLAEDVLIAHRTFINIFTDDIMICHAMMAGPPLIAYFHDVPCCFGDDPLVYHSAGGSVSEAFLHANPRVSRSGVVTMETITITVTAE